MTSSPTISVIIPTYNRAHLVGRAIRSVLAQTFQDIELIVVDDGSIDDTEAIVLDFPDPRIHYLRHEINRGGSAARNTGIRAACGEYVAFLDSDDEWLSEKLELQLNIFETNPHNLDNLGVVLTGVQSFYPEPGRRRTRVPVIPNYYGDVHPQVFQRRIQGQVSALVHKHVFAKSGFFDESMTASEDWDMLIRLAAVCEFDVVSKRLYLEHHMPGVHLGTMPNRVQGWRIIFEKYATEFARYPKYSSRLHAIQSSRYLSLNQKRQARQEAWYSVRLNPLQTRAYVVLILSLVDVRVYSSLSSLKKGFRVLRFGRRGPAPG